MEDIEKLFGRADFSKETSFKNTLHDKLFAGGGANVLSFAKELSDDELGLVNAAGTGTVVPGAADEEKGI